MLMRYWIYDWDNARLLAVQAFLRPAIAGGVCGIPRRARQGPGSLPHRRRSAQGARRERRAVPRAAHERVPAALLLLRHRHEGRGVHAAPAPWLASPAPLPRATARF